MIEYGTAMNLLPIDLPFGRKFRQVTVHGRAAELGFAFQQDLRQICRRRRGKKNDGKIMAL